MDDLAEACVFLINHFDGAGLVNVGTGTDLSILELAELVARITGFKGSIQKDISKPDGTPRKLMDVSKINSMGWKARITLEDGIKMVYGADNSKLAVGS